MNILLDTEYLDNPIAQAKVLSTFLEFKKSVNKLVENSEYRLGDITLVLKVTNELTDFYCLTSNSELSQELFSFLADHLDAKKIRDTVLGLGNN